ncbi:GNAT family N-acetyltransferase [Paenibacillus sp. GCM10027628]|uniref:GNAT family N-acetyltransferase n=1 Tax=Paenibacillus sp. GCM10027628 TaxID=3273413 RepID=UPI00363488D2
MLEEIEIFEASPSQVEEVLAIWLEAAYWMESKGIDQWKPAHFNRDVVLKYFENRHIFLAKYKDEYVGSFALQWSDPSVWGEMNNEESGYLHRFVVRRTQAGQGIGGYFLQWIENYVKSKDKQYLRLDCMAANEVLNTYYRSHHFIYRGTYHLSHGTSCWQGSLYEKEL